ncbi:hypothetical protein ACFQ44_06890 [Levilactobacillus lanxiensis]|uniref:Lipoprotein n=1 Tax=Levilactobacillus lanxiensis TaxID=2799568 RepID=A0ABW4D1G1_9LACO|nr:hypothetical protein [Levilactobacillus lanxiensis]
MKNKKILVCALILAGFIAGCSGDNGRKAAGSSESVATTSSKITDTKNSSSVKKSLAIGKIVSIQKSDPNVAYKMSNKRVKFYHSLKDVGTKHGIISDYQEEKGEIFGIKQMITAGKGVYYHMIEFGTGGFEKNSDEPDDMGYVKASDVTRLAVIKSEWTYTKKKAYYIADPNSHRIWNRPVYTMSYTYITHVFDRLTTQQLYATKELITHKNKHYVFLETAKGRKLGWVFKARHTLIAGKYQDPGKQLLTVKKHEKLVTKVQSKKSTGNRVGVNDSLSLRQRAYLVMGKNKMVSRVLVISMDNRPTKIYFRNGHAVKIKTYTYRRKLWKSSTNKRKLRTKYVAEHADNYLSVDSIHSRFYSTSNKKLVRVNTVAFDGYGSVIIYRNGKVKFITGGLKETYNYPYANFK